ncbi:MAG: XRE family transcriptional regulator [Lachnospiraceae bacterium]|jgi:transcriptional regulator with XRE-family HTH domain|nr:XRE family transcriptional regulator [Lachnospiraceae bacterium]SDA47765.1 Helix-turn-helix [Lachnospiraceae bacterium G11]
MKVFDANTFGEVIKRQRKKMGYTQKYICEVSGISASYISDLENGKATIELGKAIQLANLLGIDVELTERG